MSHKSALVDAESFQATHIMYRNLSLGFWAILLVQLWNIVRDLIKICDKGLNHFGYTKGVIFISIAESLFILAVCWVLSLLAFERAYKFLVWFKREIYLGYYFAVNNREEKPLDLEEGTVLILSERRRQPRD